MLVIMLVIAAALSFVSYQGIGEGKTLSAGNIKQGLDLSGGVYIVYEADKEDVTAEEMQAAVSLIQGRMDWNGWTEAEVAREGTNRIRVDIPGVENAEEAIREIGQTAQLSFVDETGKVLLTGDMVADATKQVGATQKGGNAEPYVALKFLSLIHISEPTRRRSHQCAYGTVCHYHWGSIHHRQLHRGIRRRTGIPHSCRLSAF